MNRDLIEIHKILEVVETNEGTHDDTSYVLDAVCANTSEKSRKEKVAEWNEHKEDYKKYFQKHMGAVYKICKMKSCDKCPISKWCNSYRNKVQSEELKKTGPTYADFFCGAGGLSWGFHRAGFRMSLANDIQECCIDTISLNHPEVPEKNIIAGDINDVLDRICDLSRFKNVDVVAGGPPCQGFSMANRQRLIDDPRNHLYKSFVKGIDLLKPKFFVMENVRGMLKVKKQILQNFKEIGYTASAYILNAKDFGIPQNRERVIFIGNRIGIDNELVFSRVKKIGKTHLETCLGDALYGLPILSAKTVPNATELEDEISGYTFFNNFCFNTNSYINLINEFRNIEILYNHKARYNNPRDIEIFSRLLPGNNSADPKIADIMPYKRREKIFKDKYFKLDSQKVCKTITAHMKFDCNMYIHPSQARGLTPREAARIQSFPDDYFFRGPYTKTYMQVGNSVPPLLGEAIANAIKQALSMEV